MFCELEKAPKDLSGSDRGWSSSSELGGSSWYHPKKARATQSVSFPSIKSQFHILMKEWRRDTDCVSSIQEIVDNSAYRAIIDLGKPALPFILADLRDEGALWFEALRQIAGEDPVTPEIRGDFTKMRDNWILWGQSRRYL